MTPARGAALPLDPELGRYPAAAEIQPTTFGRFVPLAGRDGQLPVVETTSQAEAPPTALGRIAYRARRAASTGTAAGSPARRWRQ
jgi:hypothetical protein